MTDPAHQIELMPAEITEALETAGIPPQAVSGLMQIIEDFARAKADAGTPTARLEPDEEEFALKALLPDDSWYEAARRAAEAGRLPATLKNSTRWFATPTNVARWMPTTRRGQREGLTVKRALELMGRF